MKELKSITIIQYWTFKDPESEQVEYWGNIAIDGSFIIQFHGNQEECTYSVPTSSEQCWNNPEAQDGAHEQYTKGELVAFVESQGFENNLYYVEEHGELQ